MSPMLTFPPVFSFYYKFINDFLARRAALEPFEYNYVISPAYKSLLKICSYDFDLKAWNFASPKSSLESLLN